MRVGTNESRRHMTHYTKGIPQSAPFRNRLTQISSASEVVDILSELALLSAGKEGQERFLAAVENYDFEDCKHPGEGDSNCKSSFKAQSMGIPSFQSQNQITPCRKGVIHQPITPDIRANNNNVDQRSTGLTLTEPRL